MNILSLSILDSVVHLIDYLCCVQCNFFSAQRLISFLYHEGLVSRTQRIQLMRYVHNLRFAKSSVEHEKVLNLGPWV